MTYGAIKNDPGFPEVREAAAAPAKVLFDHELVGLVLGRDPSAPGAERLCEKIFELFAGRALSPVTPEEITSGCGLPETEAARLSAAIELARRLLWPEEGMGPIRSPRDACRAAARIRCADREHFIVLYLNARNVVISEETISVGSLNANIVHPREVFRPAITGGAAAVILVHNHPSGDVAPSREDLSLTSRLAEAGRLLGIEVLDHLIVAGQRYLSFRSESYL
ncbi:MAG: DNA repair protein RadC [Thermoleophilia bacterium]|nr:DNA repair protein RadC [Thermoleophilia bacterium]